MRVIVLMNDPNASRKSYSQRLAKIEVAKHELLLRSLDLLGLSALLLKVVFPSIERYGDEP